MKLMLPTKFDAAQFSITQKPPKHGFGNGWLLSHRPRAVRKTGKLVPTAGLPAPAHLRPLLPRERAGVRVLRRAMFCHLSYTQGEGVGAVTDLSKLAELLPRALQLVLKNRPI
ncbi:MAG TPA: hypothetical protein VHO25_12340 [Polyangiaceae bacterium]|nr:hypothetical protein [Polyangiaceae bacterium]